MSKSGKANKTERLIEAGKRLTEEEALWLLKNCGLAELGQLAWNSNMKMHGGKVYYNRNIHIEPTNICVFRCRFCSFSRDAGHSEAWDLSEDELLARVKTATESGITEIHIVGGVHPERDVHYYAALLRKIRQLAPYVHIKAFTAIELNYMFRKAGADVKDGFAILKDAGLGSIPGGGAEIFNETIRRQICPEKGSAHLWLKIHEEAHRMGIPSNATMLYGHLESPEDIIHHLSVLRNLQDRTGGFNCFIPLKYRNYNNLLSELEEKPWIYDLRIFALSRIFLDNIPHLKAYWPMLGKPLSALLLSFGANDFDGTISDSTKIYSMAGAEEQKPEMSALEIQQIIRREGFLPVERDSVYNETG
jgi:aminodeoxyfutalosine synthase